MMSNKGFTLIEMLVAIWIISMVIVLMSFALKQFFMYKEKLEKYKHMYITTISLVDKLMAEPLLKKRLYKGSINQINYKYEVKIIEKKRNFLEIDEFGKKLTGKFDIFLLKIILTIDGKKYEFYKTEYKKID